MKDEWWFASGGARKGPVKFEFLREKVLDGSLSASDLVWTEGMSAWTPVSGVPELHQVMQALPPELPQSMAPEPPALSAPAAPWRRFFARFIDLWVIGLPTVFLVAFFLAPLWPGFALWLQQPGADVALGFLVIPLVLVIEAGIFGLFGTTLGKGLLGVHVKTSTAQKPSFSEYLHRQLRVYWYGLGTGFPLVSFFTYVRQYRRLKAGMTASYDEGLFTVTAEKIGFLRSAVAVTVVAALLVINSILQMMSSVAEQRSPEVVAVSNNGLITEKDEAVSQSNPSNPGDSLNTELQPGSLFKDCVDCPEMVVVPAGSFTMGSSAAEQKKAQEAGRSKEQTDWESPQREVTVRSFAAGQHAVTKSQFARFVQVNGYKTEAERSVGCVVYTDTWNTWEQQADKNWRNPGFAQGNDHPVVCVSWNDAQAYAQWLSQTTGKAYRLLSEAEREYAARAGSQTAFWWGDSISTAQANYNGNFSYNGSPKGAYRQATVPVGSFNPNPFGLYNAHGNVWEWVQDCFEDNYSKGQPGDGSAHKGNDSSCSRRVLRGGSWVTYPDLLRSARRSGSTPVNLINNYGFRIARTIP